MPNRHFKDCHLSLEFQTMENDEEVNQAASKALSKRGMPFVTIPREIKSHNITNKT